MYRAIIIDDELAGINSLRLLIEKNITGLKVVATASEPEKGILLINDYQPDVVFLDISMPGMNGFELLKKVDYKNFKIVFTTAHEEYAIPAIKSKAFDYLLKPIDIDELKDCVNLLLKELDGTTDPNKLNAPGLIELFVKSGIIFIKPNEIIRLEASGSYTIFYLTNNIKQLVSKSMKEYEILLDPHIFYRCHNSHIVNLTKVIKFTSNNGFYAEMIDGSVAEIARKNKDIFLERLKNIAV
jgi:two-component system LytT family response regulator